MTALPDLAFKDHRPEQTVARIKEILAAHGIDTTEVWYQSGVPQCHSVHIGIAGTPFGANGKGITKELTLASGYGELMERLQLGYLVKSAWQKGSLPGGEASADLRLSPEELPQLSLYCSLAQDATGAPLTEQELLKQYTDPDGKISVTAFTDAGTGETVYLPTGLCRSVYTTNGCAAGNTMAEAMVQAISEIVERTYKKKILSDGIAAPEVSEDVLRSYPIAWEIIDFLRQKEFHVSVRDCSLGSKFPVVCVCLVDRRTGRYHTHFGAFPHFEIALQRTLTESFQGRTLEKIGQYENFCPSTADAQSLRYLMNELVRGTSEKTPEFFLADTSNHIPTAGFSGRDNRALLAECLEFFREQGLQVLVRDCSCLGFPTCQILIPGYSEVFPHRLSPRHNDLRYSTYAKPVLRDPAAARPDQIMGYLMHLSQTTDPSSSFLAQANLAAEISPREDAYLRYLALAHIHYSIGKLAEARKALENAVPLAPVEEAEYLICLKRYLDLSRSSYSQEKIRAILTYFHRAQTVTRMYALLQAKQNPLNPVVLCCHEQCNPDCRLFAACRQRDCIKLSQTIHKKQLQLKQASLRDLLGSL